jgi:hypothetical protein
MVREEGILLNGIPIEKCDLATKEIIKIDGVKGFTWDE